MHIKFLDHGTGSALRAAQYLLDERDHRGRLRAHIAVLRGDPIQFAMVADSLVFRHRYRSALMAWAPDDHPTQAQIDETLRAFASLAFAGLPEDRMAWTAVRHDDEAGGIHVHVLIARVDLNTGKAFNPAPPGWQKDFDPLRDALNLAHGWARPDDPARARILQPGRLALFASGVRRERLAPADAKVQITDWLIRRISAGLINDRSGVVASLKELGEVTRQGADYISVIPRGFVKAVRLKGVIYGETFSSTDLSVIEGEGGGQVLDRSSNKQAAEDARNRLATAIHRRMTYNKQRYRIPLHGAKERNASDGPAAGAAIRDSDLDAPDRLPFDLRRSLGLSIPESFNRRDADEPRFPSVYDEPVRFSVMPATGLQGEAGLTGRLFAASRQNKESSLLPLEMPGIGAWLRRRYDRVGRSAVAGLRGAIEGIGNAIGRARSGCQELVAAGFGLGAVCGYLDEAIRRHIGQDAETEARLGECLVCFGQEVERACPQLANRQACAKVSDQYANGPPVS